MTQATRAEAAPAMMATDPVPSRGRIVAAILLAPWAPSLAVALAGPYGNGGEEILMGIFVRLYWGLLLTYLWTLLLGLPVLLVLRRGRRQMLRHYTLIGVGIAVFPVGVLDLLGPMPAELVVNLLGLFIVLGALGGAAFWAVAAARWEPRAPQVSPRGTP